MATSKKLEYSIQRRIEVWVETPILASDFEDAVAQAKALKLDDFLVAADGASVIDYNYERGLAVIEQ